jgi:hypothetical protein
MVAKYLDYCSYAYFDFDALRENTDFFEERSDDFAGNTDYQRGPASPSAPAAPIQTPSDDLSTRSDGPRRNAIRDAPASLAFPAKPRDVSRSPFFFAFCLFPFAFA